MRKIYLLAVLIGFFTSSLLNAQLNVSYVGDITYSQNLSDIWGYVTPEGDEYALVGVNNGVSVVDLSDPANPTEAFFFAGASSTWRDIKTWDEYAYITNETGGGLMVLDLTGLPDNASATNWAPTIAGEGTLSSIHNIWIDEFGYAYLAGSSLNNGGMIYVNLFDDPANPEFAGLGPSVYSHDVFTRNNVMYSSEIYIGEFTIYDVSDKGNTQILGSHPTEAAFTHNTWLSDDGNILYTTDEVANAPVGAYDVSDPSDVEELDQFRPLETLGDGVIPHNVHVWQDWLIVSYYTDGCIILDGSNPTNLVEVGNFDTFLPPSTGFSGAWGAYPFLPSGLILISDIGNGMYVLQPNYVNACWLEGQVTDANTSAGIPGVDIVIESTIIFDESVSQGNYATGYAIAGTYDITFSKPGYNSLTVPAELTNGVITILDVALVPLESVNASGTVLDGFDNSSVEGATLILENDEFNFEFTSDADGNFNIENIFPGTYQVSAGLWGYNSECIDIVIDEGANNFTITLQPGVYDDFSVDLGWTTTSNASTGDWEIGDPIETSLGGGNIMNPGSDVANDCFGKAYVTGNGGGSVGDDDVDNGVVTLTSPEFDYDNTGNSILSYYRWFANDGGNGTPNDELEVFIFNDSQEILLETLDEGDNANNWDQISFDLDDLGLTGDSYQVRFVTSDGQNSGHIVEAAVDQFRIDFTVGIAEATLEAELLIQPNPSTGTFQIAYNAEGPLNQGFLIIHDELGRAVYRSAIAGQNGLIEVGASFESGVYLLQLTDGNLVSKTQRLVKL
jgi:choice-of-anchor B domain-containing protein